MKEYTADLPIRIGEVPFDCTVKFTVTPGYPQTYGQPAEGPSVDVLAISVDIGCGHVDPTPALYDMLAEAVSDEELLAHANEQEADAHDHAADMAMERTKEAAL